MGKVKEREREMNHYQSLIWWSSKFHQKPEWKKQTENVL
jgi:hypothetical protein